MIVAVGGSATIDGGLGALEALGFELGGVEVVVACDVDDDVLDAARMYGPQKGASADDIRVLEDAARGLWRRAIASEFGVEVDTLPGSGAAGGLAGGLAAVGRAARARRRRSSPTPRGCATRSRSASLVITGEGRLDADIVRGQGRRSCPGGGRRGRHPRRDRRRRGRLGALPPSVSRVSLVELERLGGGWRSATPPPRCGRGADGARLTRA